MERNIYKYNDGFKYVYADPSVLDYRILKAFERENMKAIEDDLELPKKEGTDETDWDGISEAGWKKFSGACQLLDPLVREAFNIPPFNTEDGSGLLQVDALRIYFDYIGWKRGLKKNTEETPNSASPSDSPETTSTTSITR